MLATALGLSALLTAVAITYPDCHWLAWFSLMPLFVAIRRLSSGWATWCGALWGGGIAFFASILPGGAIPNPDINAIALVAIPAAYAGLMALYSRRFGYSPLAMALGWILAELAFRTAGVTNGLLAAQYSMGPALHIVAALLGCGFAAFAVVWTNALLTFVPWKITLRCAALLREYEDPYATKIPTLIFFCPQSSSRLQEPSPRAPPESG